VRNCLIKRTLDPSSDKLAALLADLGKRELLWTDYGLRSLSTTSSIYMQYNTEHDAPYWRGPIWVNLNYMVLRGLHHYAHVVEGPHQAAALDLYSRLRDNLIDNIYRQYQTTGFLWENYNPDTGVGQGCHPFSGWTTLVVLVMAEVY